MLLSVVCQWEEADKWSGESRVKLGKVLSGCQ